MPVALLNLPAGHVVHEPALLLLLYVPVAQFAHTTAAPGEYCPAWHDTHAVWFVTFVYDPAGHTGHAPAASVEL